jgi:hypothetical protein
VKLISNENILTEKSQDTSKVQKSLHEIKGGGTKKKISAYQCVKC